MIIEESEFDQNKAYSQNEWAFCFLMVNTLRLTTYVLRK